MYPWYETLRGLRQLLDEARISGLTIREELDWVEVGGDTLSVSVITPQANRSRRDSLAYETLRTTVTQLLGEHSPVTEPCKAHILEATLLFYEYGCPTDTVLSYFDRGDDGFTQGPFLQHDFSAYELELLEALVVAEWRRTVPSRLLSAKQWAEAWLVQYRGNDCVESYLAFTTDKLKQLEGHTNGTIV